VKTLVPNRIILILASIAFVLISIVIAVNYFRGGPIQFAHVLLALGLLAYVVWFSGRRAPEE
jgi:lipopolysaccharide export LptBFGC system permease protein LptF